MTEVLCPGLCQKAMTSISLALAAGGARGAYQAGALQYLAEAGVRFSHVAGSSIGALNAAFYAQGDGSPRHVERLRQLWDELPHAGLMKLSSGGVARLATLVASQFVPGIYRVLLTLASSKIVLLDPGPIEKVLDRFMDYERIRRSPIKLKIAVVREHSFAGIVPDALLPFWRSAEFLSADALNATELRNSLLASVAIPLALPPRQVKGATYSDAGLIEELPTGILYKEGGRRIVCVFTSPLTIQNRADFPGATLFQIRPSVPIPSGLAATFDFSSGNIATLASLGYSDARRQYEAARRIADTIEATEQLSAENVERAHGLLAQLLDNRKGRLRRGK